MKDKKIKFEILIVGLGFSLDIKKCVVRIKSHISQERERESPTPPETGNQQNTMKPIIN